MNNQAIKIAVLTALTVSTSTVHATNGDQMLGVTATQWGMAGAVVAAPQDSGTVITNPAGLSLLKMEDVRFDMGFGFLNPPRKANNTESDSNVYLIPSGAVALKIDEHLTFGMGMAGLSGMGVDFADIAPLAGNQNVVTTKQFYKIAPGFSYHLNNNLALGAALNIDYQSLALDNSMMHLPQKQVYGFGFSLGAIYKLNDAMQFGASYISKQSMSKFHWNTTAGAYAMTMDAPETLTLGLAYQPGNGLLVEADIKYIGFSDVLDRVPFETPGGTTTMNFGWDDQVVFALGVQKQLNDKTTIRAGFNYGESPIDPEDVDNNIGSLAITETHLSLGATRKLGQRVEGSVSYLHAFNNKLTSSSTPTTIELEQNVINVQISYQY
ncbi:MAG: outer membrane protein transport protein [Gammaproteobacteria bacterium]|nr:outer membrane protein transport protein [Gammaproteobacteria bacterium]MCW8911635.1 outer membrane protein transport protein [Gammaproteobacteria bacterium]MCW9003686.1 outer membrane protein transport protein [Gammaproteobacteria bacterium]MCW9055789.1 outer membrane protein transport protein [Gammaproteobacteria bacterium]